MVSVFLAAALGDLLTYCVTSLQLAVAYRLSWVAFQARRWSFWGFLRRRSFRSPSWRVC